MVKSDGQTRLGTGVRSEALSERDIGSHVDGSLLTEDRLAVQALGEIGLTGAEADDLRERGVIGWAGTSRALLEESGAFGRIVLDLDRFLRRHTWRPLS